MAEKKKRGRPRLDITDAERSRRAREINKKIASKTHMVRVSLDIAKRFDEAKEKQEKILGFSLTGQQFLTILITGWENDNRK